jgi:long-chain acyl-CoA synthetase
MSENLNGFQHALRFVGEYLVIHPFLFIVGLFDFVLGLILPYKYDDATLPDKNAVLTRQVDPADPKSAYRSTMTADLVRIEDRSTNLYKAFSDCIDEHADMETMGVREVLNLEDEVQPNGKTFKKYNLAEKYTWSNYRTMHSRVDNFSNGLLHVGLKSDQNIVLFAETRPEWLMSAFACFRIKVPIVTLYSTLGIDALVFGINQTSAPFLVTSGEQLPKLQKIIKKIPNITHIIVFNDKFTEKNVTEFRKTCADTPIQVYTMDEVEKIGAGAKTITSFKQPTKDDLAIIMYTSGSTGNPKGVMISHKNILSSMRGLIMRLGSINRNKDIYIAYLPLAHILELVGELTCITNGIRLAYSSPLTIADTSTAIKKGQKGDLRVLKPTIMTSVPIVLERLSKTVYEKLSHTNWFKQTLFKVRLILHFTTC